jgi:hypothetical protein
LIGRHERSLEAVGYGAFYNPMVRIATITGVLSARLSPEKGGRFFNPRGRQDLGV